MRIIICGNYGATNIGDELILKGILSYIDAKKHNIIVLSSDPKNTKNLHNVKSLRLVPAGFKSLIRGVLKLSLFRTLRAVKRCDLFILGGGGLFDDSYPRAAIIWGIQALMAYICKKPIFIMAQSFGPLNSPLTKIIVKAVCNYAKWITVRDEKSKMELENLGVNKAKTRVKITADPVFSLNFENEEKEEKRKEERLKSKYVLVVLRQPISEGKTQILSEIFDRIHSRYGFNILFLPFNKENPNDSAAFSPFLNKKFIQQMEYTDDFSHIVELIKESQAVVGMRLHSLVLAILIGKPFLALSSYDKIKNMLFGIDLSDSYLNLQDLNAEKFNKKFENLIKNKSSNKDKFNKIRAALSHKATSNQILLTKIM